MALARAIALDPTMILYDEPFAGQDPISMGVLVKLIRTLNDALDLTSIIVSHDVKETAAIADYLYLISDGQVVEHGTPQDPEPPASPWWINSCTPCPTVRCPFIIRRRLTKPIC